LGYCFKNLYVALAPYMTLEAVVPVTDSPAVNLLALAD
jgi:hypothetical protein